MWPRECDHFLSGVPFRHPTWADGQVSVCIYYVSVLRLACSDLDDTLPPHPSATLLRCPALVTSELGSETSWSLYSPPPSFAVGSIALIFVLEWLLLPLTLIQGIALHLRGEGFGGGMQWPVIASCSSFERMARKS